MVNGMPDPDRFEQTVGTIVGQCSEGRRRARAFGEMVALLHAEGKTDAAIRLEELWNDLGKDYAFALFCAYPMADFHGDGHSDSFLHVCKCHTRVVPTESYSAEMSVDQRLRTISSLQQKAASFEAEVAQRKQVETSLREYQALLALAAGAAGFGTWELDVASNTLTCSDDCKTLLSVPAASPLTGELLFDMIHPDDRESAQAALRAALRNGTDFAQQCRVTGGDGRVRQIALKGRSFSAAATSACSVSCSTPRAAANLVRLVELKLARCPSLA